MPYKTVVLPSQELVYLLKQNRLYTMMGTSEVVKCRNSQAVQKAEASMVNTIWVRIKTARESVNPCDIAEML